MTRIDDDALDRKRDRAAIDGARIGKRRRRFRVLLEIDRCRGLVRDRHGCAGG
jgi:hypothetical protein